MPAKHSLLRMSFHPVLFTIVILLWICKSLVVNHGRILDSQDIPVAQASSLGSLAALAIAEDLDTKIETPLSTAKQ